VIGFLGQHTHQMDAKGRVSLPSAFRREAEADRFVLLQWQPDHLTLFPDEKWREVQGRLMEIRRSNPEGWNQVRMIIANAVEVAPDKQGRILVPAALQESSGLSGSVLVNGNLDCIELWNPETYRASVQEPTGDFAQVAHRVFG